MKNLLENGVVEGSLTAFNGYLIVGQYLIGVLGLIINFIAGGSFETLAKAVAVASYIFFGCISILPWLLFRQKLGVTLSLICMMMLWMVPLGSYDYFIIGTIGNTKFAFLFIATLLVIYRNDVQLCSKRWQLILVDFAILLCILTNIVSIGLLPLLLLRHINEIKRFFQTKNIKTFFSFSSLSLLFLCLVSVAYLATVYIKGVPQLAGYFEGELDKSALVAIFYSSTTYALTFPVAYLFNDFFAILSMIILGVVIMRRRTDRLVSATVIVAISFSVLGFVLNRPGVTHAFATYDQRIWTDNFFYAGTMLTFFIICYVFAEKFSKLSFTKRLISLIAVGGAVILFLPAAGYSRVDPYGNGSLRPTLAGEVRRICAGDYAGSTKDKVIIQVYPYPGWTMEMSKGQVCGR